MFLLYRRAANKISRLSLQLQDVRFSKQSLSTKYGKMTEQFIPFLKVYPYNENNFRFLGTPVDGVQFEDDKIIFMEFKTGDSKLSEKQKQIKDLVQRRKIDFEEIRIK
jgi:predicted Holliday junction resolvase-like endonuclease